MNLSLSSLVIPSRPRTGAGVGFLAVVALFTCGATHSARAAADAFTSPRGIYTVKAAGKPAGQSQARTYFGVQLLPDTKFYGVVSAVSGDAISFNGNSSYQGLADLERTSYAHVITGNGRGFIVDIAEFRQADIRCAQNLSGWITPGTQVSIRPHPHLADMFGADNRFGLGSGLYADSADNVVAWDAQTQQERVYYFHSTRARWEEKDIEADASRAIMRFPYGLYIVRRTPGTLRIALSGEIAANPLLLPVRTGANVFSLPINLSRSLGNLISTTGDFPVLSGRNSNRSDLLTFEEPFTGIQRGPFYHSSRPNSGGWREVGESGNNSVTLDLLSTLVLRRNGPPGYVRAEGSLVPGPVPPVLPPNPEPGELPLYGYLPFPPNPRPELIYEVQISTDLQTWTFQAIPTFENGRLKFQLPAGQGRGFYRLRVFMAT
jgi:hypothetical protein